VGATTHRRGFYNHTGMWAGSPYGDQGFIASFSSVGPSLERITKPDVTAPGNNIVSSFSSYFLADNPDDVEVLRDVCRYQYNGREYSWNAQSGTSMSCPIVTGIIAQWMQAYPQLNREQIIAAFTVTCRHPEASYDYPNNYYGYGEINAQAGLQYLEEMYTGCISPRPSEMADDTYYTLSGMRINNASATRYTGILIDSRGKKIINKR